jgi:HEAT repeat protein
MSKELLHALVTDVDRLVAAGASLAAADDGLQKREKTLRELGKKVPALAQVADKVQRARAAKTAEAPGTLLDLLLTSRQILVSVAQVGAEGTPEAVLASGPWTTAAPARDLYPLMEMLGSSGAGRLEALKGALERGVTADLRLVDSWRGGLEDGYGELADLIAEQALPKFGPTLVPELRQGLNLKGNKVDGRRLLAISRLDAKLGGELCKAAIADGSAPVRIQALKCLFEIDPGEAERAALALLSGKGAAEVRLAALTALQASRSDAALDALIQGAFLGRESIVEVAGAKLAIATLAQLPHPGTTKRLLAELESAAAAALPVKEGKAETQPAKPSKELSPEERTVRLVSALQQRADKKAVPALVSLLQHQPETSREYDVHGRTDPMPVSIREAAAEALIELGEPKSLEVVADFIKDDKLWRQGVHAAWKLPAKARYDLLAPLCEGLSSPKKAQRERGEYVLSLFKDEACNSKPPKVFHCLVLPRPNTPIPTRSDWDPRWAKLLLPHLDGPNRSDLAMAMGVVMGRKAIPELLRVLEASAKKNEIGVIEELGRLQAKEAIPSFLELFAGLKEGQALWALCEAFQELGDPSIIPSLEEIVAKSKKSNYLDHFIEQLRVLFPQ